MKTKKMFIGHVEIYYCDCGNQLHTEYEQQIGMCRFCQ